MAEHAGDPPANPELLKAEPRYRQYWDEMPCYLSVHDREFRIIDGNRRFRTDFGNRIGDYCYRVYKGLDSVCPECPVEATFADGKSHPSEQKLTTRQGDELPVMVHTTPVRNGDDEIIAVGAVSGVPGPADFCRRKNSKSRRGGRFCRG